MELAARLGAAAADVTRRAERAVHRLARPTAYALAPVLLRQARRAQESLVGLPEPRDERHGRVGDQHEGEPMRLLLVGDSTATGVGTERLEEALAVQTALRLAELRQRPVTWRIIGQEGSNAADVLRRDLPQVDGPDRDAILLLVGANDAMQLVSRAAFSRSIRQLVVGLAVHLAPGGVIALAGAPQIDTFAWLPQPMRSLLGGHARSLDDALQRIAAAEPHVIHLPTPAILEPLWHASDGFHPSAAGYAMWAQIIAPRLHAALAERVEPLPESGDAERSEAQGTDATGADAEGADVGRADADAAEAEGAGVRGADVDAAVRRGIVPPYLLEHLAAADTPAATVAARTLGVDRSVRADRAERAEPARPGLLAPAPERVPDGPPAPRRSVSDARGTTTLPGDEVRAEGDEPTGDAAVDQAYDGLGASWRMLFEAFGRNSLDDRGLPLLATVHYGKRYDNAFWDGRRMVFGDGDGEVFAGFTNAIDVIGHELGHGVISSTADLVYRDQSGALNESIADVLGSLVKQHHLGQSADEADWLIGAGVFTDKVQGEALRSMAAPGTAYDDPVLGKDPQPAHMRDFVVTADDLGGVHINSGIPNKAFHLVATALGGYAWEAAGLIWMDALTGDLSPTADFATFAQATVDASVERYGDDAAETEAVRAAWAAVGVSEQTAPADASAENEVRVARTGGMLGRTRAAVLELQVIPGHDREQLDTLVASGVLADLDGQTLPDAPLWRVTIETRCDVTVAEPLLPDEVLSLFRRLLELDEV